MTLRRWFFTLLLAVPAFAIDGIPPRDSAGDYPAHQTAATVALGAAYVSAAEAKKLFGDDLDKHGYVVFEVAVFPLSEARIDLAADDFKLRQGKDPSIVHAATPHQIAADIRPEKVRQPKLPSNVTVYTVDTIGYESGPYGRGVHTDTTVGVGIGAPRNVPPPPSTSTPSQAELEQRLQDQSLPTVKTPRAVAGYVFFPKPSKNKPTEFELIYFGQDGQISLKVSAGSK